MPPVPRSSPTPASPVAPVSDSLLADPERLELRAPAYAASLGRTVVVAPHPDDESLACGGLLALLARAGVEAHVVVVADGSASHVGSTAFPPSRLAALREAEVREAVRRLGHGERTHLLNLPDGAVPMPGADDFAPAVVALRALIEALQPETLVLPWRRDPHPDHVAAWHIADAAAPVGVRRLEAPVWAWHRGGPDAAPRADEATAWRLDISPVLAEKAAAIAAHVSQVTGLISDADEAFTLTPELLAPFERTWELYMDAA